MRCDVSVKIVTLNTAVIGSGASGLCAAVRLAEMGIDAAVITEDINGGTSKNTGSDKQTYYKLGLCAEEADSVRAMAKDFFSGGSADGDNALIEAAMSPRCFYHLCELGVPFPTNRYGEYVGYKTDHDEKGRATSAGPLTSKFMTEALEKRADELGIAVYDKNFALSLIKNGGEACGVLALDTAANEYVLYNCKNVVLATGGPAVMYADTVYPHGHFGASGLAFSMGAKGQNLTEWQYGLASVEPKWNVSGTYMQVLPRFISVDKDGTERDFLLEYFGDAGKCLDMIFLKGYQWPFDSKKVKNGSSVIDILVYRECVLRGRRVYLDYTENPCEGGFDFSLLGKEAYEYLQKANACFGKPYERLKHMNGPAFELYKSKGVDLSKEKLEISLCAQHNNGGIAVDMWWQTSVEGLFAIGEAAGTHGVSRPGGSALNAGQAGALRAAQYIAHKRQGSALAEDEFERAASPSLRRFEALGEKILANAGNNARERLAFAQKRMSAVGGAVRNAEKIKKALCECEKELLCFENTVSAKNREELTAAFHLLDALICQRVYLSAMYDYSLRYKSRGSAVYYDEKGELMPSLEECFRFAEDGGESLRYVQEACIAGDAVCINYRNVRPLPEDDFFFENVWQGYRKNGNVF